MDNFVFSVPTTIFFGEGQARAFAEAVESYGEKALIVFGGGSIKRNGIYDEITTALHAAGVKTVDHGGIEPNPRVESVRAGIDRVKKEGVDVIVPMGGGSTIDAAKLIAAGALTAADPWKIVIGEAKVTGRCRSARCSL